MGVRVPPPGCPDESLFRALEPGTTLRRGSSLFRPRSGLVAIAEAAGLRNRASAQLRPAFAALCKRISTQDLGIRSPAAKPLPSPWAMEHNGNIMNRLSRGQWGHLRLSRFNPGCPGLTVVDTSSGRCSSLLPIHASARE